MGTVRVITPPTIYPVTLDEVKDWCKIVLPVGDTREDGNLNMLIKALTRYGEHVTGRAFCERTLEFHKDWFDYEVYLPFPPLIELLSVKYTDSDGNEQAIDPADYYVDMYSEPARVRGRSGYVWPALDIHDYNPVRYRYRAGYPPPTSPADSEDRSWIPDEFRLWMQARIVTIYNNREVAAFGFHTAQTMPRSIHDAMLDGLIIAEQRFG